MKSIIGVTVAVCILASIAFLAGRASIPTKTFVEEFMGMTVKDVIENIAEQTTLYWVEVHDKGVEAGKRTGFDKGYIACYNGLGMNWLGSHNRFMEFTKKYGNLHNTPWNELMIEEKFTIAMYGGSGSKLEPEEVEEWASKYGVKKEVVPYTVAKVTYKDSEKIDFNCVCGVRYLITGKDIVLESFEKEVEDEEKICEGHHGYDFGTCSICGEWPRR